MLMPCLPQSSPTTEELNKSMKRKIGIVAPQQNGDLITCTSVLRYREELWGDADIVWFCNEPHSDALKFQDIEIRNFPHGWAIPEQDVMGQYAGRIQKDFEEGKPAWQDLSLLMTKDNRLDQELKYLSESTKDLNEAYFPVPWMMSPQRRHGLSYPECSKRIFGIPEKYEWHPVLKFSDEERENAKEFMYELPEGKNVCIESFAGSSQSKITGLQISDAMNICRQVLGKCNFIFMSHKFINGDEKFPEGWINNVDVFSAAHFTVRQCALIVEKSSLLISVSSGISVASSAWGLKTPPTLQFCGSRICSTAALNTGRFELVTTDGKHLRDAVSEFNTVLYNLLNDIK